MSVFIIAEIGSAWRFGWELRGDHVVQAKKAIDIAKHAGADCVKFQWCSDPRLMEQRRNVPEGSYDILAWPQEWIKEFYEYATAQGIEFLCTVFLPKDVEILNPYVQRWKVASLEREDGDLLTAMQRTDKEIIASHGAADVTAWRCRMEDISLHCCAAYPAPLESLNLSVIENEAYDGYSDHSGHVLTGALAVACGAKIVETHFRLWETPESNPEYGHSLSPQGLGEYIDNIRLAERMLGDGIKRIEKCEEWALKHKVKL